MQLAVNVETIKPNSVAIIRYPPGDSVMGNGQVNNKDLAMELLVPQFKHKLPVVLLPDTSDEPGWHVVILEFPNTTEVVQAARDFLEKRNG